MLEVAVFLVLGSGIFHSVWNLLAKKSRDKNVFLWAIGMFSAICLLPFLLFETGWKDIPMTGYTLIAVSICLQSGYSWFMSRAYVYGDLSQLYPIMRGTGVVLIPLIGVFLLGEVFSPWAWAGIACIVAGIVLMNAKGSSRKSLSSNKGILSAFAIGLTITAYSITDKYLLNYLHPLTLLQLSNLGFALPLFRSVWKTKNWKTELKINWRLLLLGAILSPCSYLMYLQALRLAPISHLAPLRECGTVFGTLLGIIILKEKQALRRLTAAAVVTAGILIIGLIV
jgi:drug/metabolite transporter (DMT)-like permease